MPLENNINLSIIIPIYNEENYLEKLFNELIQYFNYKDIEVITIDDGSNDNSSKIINDFIKSQKFKFIFKPHKLDINSERVRQYRQGSKIHLVNLYFFKTQI